MGSSNSLDQDTDLSSALTDFETSSRSDRLKIPCRGSYLLNLARQLSNIEILGMEGKNAHRRVVMAKHWLTIVTPVRSKRPCILINVIAIFGRGGPFVQALIKMLKVISRAPGRKTVIIGHTQTLAQVFPLSPPEGQRSRLTFAVLLRKLSSC